MNIFKKAIKEAKDLDAALTECKTPKFRKSTPPPPSTTGSDAVKPNPTVYVMKLEELDDWVKTKAQIGDVAYYYDRMLDHHYIYCYRKPDDNPFWIMMPPEILEKHFKTENKGGDTMIGTMNCTYETPCGWCTKWDKKCDKKPYKRGLRVEINPIDDAIGVAEKEVLTNKICETEEDHEWECCGISTEGSDYRCKKCGKYKFEPYTTSTSSYYKGELI